MNTPSDGLPAAEGGRVAVNLSGPCRFSREGFPDADAFAKAARWTKTASCAR